MPPPRPAPIVTPWTSLKPHPFRQVHALRIDFLEREKCEHLARPYRRNTALPAENFLNLLRASAVPKFIDHFGSIEPTALASASIGQVHRARLNDGQVAVIKTIKRNVRDEFRADVATLRRLFRLAAFLYPKLRQVGDPVGILGDIEDYTLSELDLRHEVAGQRTLRAIYEQHRDAFDLSCLAFARVHEPLCNEHVMVADFIPGRSFDELLEAGELSYDTLLELFHLHGFYMFCMGTFHGDMHPGNALLADDKLCFIDTRYIGHVGPKIRRGLFEFFAGLSEFDYPRCAAALHRMSERRLPGAAFDTFKGKFLELYADFKDCSVAQVSLTRKMMQTFKLGVHSGMTFEKGVFATIRSLMYLLGMVLRCKADAMLLRDMWRFIREFEKMV